MTTLTAKGERTLVGACIAASRDLARVARAVLDRDDAVTVALLEAGDDTDRFKDLVAVLDRHSARAYGLVMLDLVTEISQQELERRGEPRTYVWPEGRL